MSLSLAVIPRLEAMFSDLLASLSLPWPTRVVLACSRVLQRYWYLIIIGFTALIAVRARMRDRHGMVLRFDLPVFTAVFMWVAFVVIGLWMVKT
jgi:type II secretory pathway component PulF